MRTGAPVTRNVGGLDRGLRWIAATVLLAIAFFVDLAGVWRMLAFLIGTATAFTALCAIARSTRRLASIH
jgi:hypothetical protein